MSGPAARPLYRKHSRDKIRQGDISQAEFVQLRTPRRDRRGPGDITLDDQGVPYFGRSRSFELAWTTEAGREETRTLILWEGPVMVLHQNCEIDFASENDSRLLVAPIVFEEQWPGPQWDVIRKDQMPGFFYLPPLTEGEATELGLENPLPEGAVALASACAVGREVVRHKRFASISQMALGDFQDAIARFFTVRGYTSTNELPNLAGKRLIRLDDTGLSVDGPSRLIKMIFGDEVEAPDLADEEATVTYFGFRKAQPRPGPAAAVPPTGTVPGEAAES